MNLVGGQTSGDADRIVVGKLPVRQLRLPIASALVGTHSQHFGHCVVNTLHTTVTTRVVGAGDDFSNTKKLADNVQILGAELEAVLREDITRAPPKGNVLVDKDVGRPPSCEFSDGDSGHVRVAAKAVGEKKNVRVTLGRDRQWLKAVHADRNARSQRERNPDDGPTNRQSQCLSRLALQAVTQPPAGANAYSYPPVV